MERKQRVERGRVFLRGTTYWIAYYAAGKERRESSGSEREDDANRLLRKRLADKDAGRPVLPKAERIGFADMVAMLEDDYQAKGNRSADTMRRAVARLRAHFGDWRAVEVTSGAWLAYVRARLKAKAMPATVQKERAALARMFTLAYRDGKVPARPYFEPLRVDNARQGFLSDEDLRALLAHLPADLRPVVRFLALTGWRKSEALNLTWKAVDFAAGTLRLTPSETKARRARVFPFGVLPELSDLLREQYRAAMALERETGREVSRVFTRRGEPITDFYGAWRSACRRAGLAGRVPHDLRRSAAMALRRAGLAESDIMELCGWETRAMFQRYALKDEPALAKAVERFAAHRERVTAEVRHQE